VLLFEVFFTALGGTAVALAAAAYLARRFIDFRVSKAVARYQAELEQKSEVLKAELSIYAHEQNVGLSRIDQQRSEAIQAIYGLSIKWHDLFLEITLPNPPQRLPPELQLRRYLNLAQNSVKVAEDLSTKVRDTAILFQQASYEIIARYGSAAMDLSCDFYDSTFGKVDMSKDPRYEELFPMIEKERANLRNAPKEDFGKLQSTLVSEFRRLMKAERSERLTMASTPMHKDARG
jgi:hypothetical protein